MAIDGFIGIQSFPPWPYRRFCRWQFGARRKWAFACRGMIFLGPVALRDICLSLATGDFVTVIGSNRAGKSTLLNVVAGRYRPELGTVRIAGRDVK